MAVIKHLLLVEPRQQLIWSLICVNVALAWLVCWPFAFQFQDRRKWGFALFKLVFVVGVVTTDLLIAYAMGKT